MPWEFLELDPAVATTKDVKRAYAKRLKSCRPDQDPEGFQKLHQAYTSALAELEGESRQAEHTYAIPGPGPVPVPIPSADPPERRPEGGPNAGPARLEVVTPASAIAPSAGQKAIEEALAQLAFALASPPEEAGEIPEKVRAAEAVLYAYPAEVRSWGEGMAGLIVRHEAHEHLRLKPEALLFEMEHEGYAATFAVIERLERLAREDALFSLSRFMLANVGRIGTEAGGLAMARLAGAGAIWESSLVPDLADFAYRHLGRGERDFRMHLVEQLRAVGGLLRQVPDAWKLFWSQRLLIQGDDFDWESEKGRQAIHLLLTEGRRWQCNATLRNLIPVELRRQPRLPTPLPNSNGDPTRSSSAGMGDVHHWEHLPKPRRRSGSSRSRLQVDRRFPHWAGGILIAILVKVLLLVVQCGDSEPDPPERSRLHVPGMMDRLPTPLPPTDSLRSIPTRPDDDGFHADPPFSGRGTPQGFPPVGPMSLPPQPVR